MTTNSSSPDWRGLCEELVRELHGYASANPHHDSDALVARARAALAQPEPEGRPAPAPAGEVGELVEWLRDRAESTSLAHNALRITRAADLLEQRHPTPVPVAERLPGPEDCDEEGQCWAWDYLAERWGLWPHESIADGFYHWLPAHALPVPSGEVEA